VVSGGRRMARLCVHLRRFAEMKGCRELRGMFSSRLVIDIISKPNRHCSSASPKMQVSGSQRARSYSTHADRRQCLIRMGSDRAKIWCMTAVSPGASLPLRGSTVVWIFLLRPGRFCGMCSAIFVVLAGSPWGWVRDARSSALWMEICLEAASTGKGNGLLEMVPKSTSKIDLHRGEMGSSQPDVSVTWRLRMCRFVMLAEASLRCLRCLRA